MRNLQLAFLNKLEDKKVPWVEKMGVEKVKGMENLCWNIDFGAL